MEAPIDSWVNELSKHEQRSREISLTPSFFALPSSGALWAVLFGATLIVTISVTASAQVLINKSTMKPDVGWATTWGSAQLQPYGTEVLPAGTLDGSTLRQVVHLSAGGTRLRLRLSNAFGQEPLQLRAVHVACRAASNAAGEIEVSTDRTVTFAGQGSIAIPMGADYVSDAVTMTMPAQGDLVVTLFVAHAPPNITFHAGARATSFLVKGQHVAEAQLESPETFTRWYFLAGVEIAQDAVTTASVVAFGDSITDGHGATTDGNDRWPDVLARRMATYAPTRQMGVVNEGIGGNRVLADGLGPNALARFDRDVLSVAGVRTLILMEGINDLGGLDRTETQSSAAHDAMVMQLMTAFGQMVAKAHAHGVKVLGATLTPYVGSDYYHPGAAPEADRMKLNEWIRHSGAFDGVVDFDLALRDPAHPDRMLPAYDSGDHLHPGPPGYKRMGEVVPLDLLP